MPHLKSISDDDLCAQCSNCAYRPGETSGCQKDWPGTQDQNGYFIECTRFDAITSPEQNWATN